MRNNKFRVTRDTHFFKKDTIVYSPRGPDYGLAGDDTRMTGIEHVSVTLNSDGDYPTSTVPRDALERIE